MKEDVELTRKIVLALRDHEGLMGELEGVSPEAFRRHAFILVERGLATMSPGHKPCHDGIPSRVFLQRLTANGEDFARGIEMDTTWEKIKAHLLASVGFLTTEGIKAAIGAIARGAFP